MLQFNHAQHNLYNGLVLAGGGARAAYQIGILKALNEQLSDHQTLPFRILAGTSAGSLNAAMLASHADHFDRAVQQSERLWRNIDAGKVYKTGYWDILNSLKRLTVSALKHDHTHRSVSILDTAPLWRHIQQHINFDDIRNNISNGSIHAIGVNATSYTNGGAICFYEGHDSVKNWNSGRRFGIEHTLGPEHLMASCAIPFILPAVKVGQHYYGDGAIRQISPLSSALHLGAKKLMVIGLSDNSFHKTVAEPTEENMGSPAIGGLFGHIFSSAFIDAFDADVESLGRINHLIGMAQNADPNVDLGNYRSIDFLVINPSEPIDEIAARHIQHLPKSLKKVFNFLGISENGGAGASLASFLMFDGRFCGELIDLGYRDGLAHSDMMHRFFGVPVVQT